METTKLEGGDEEDWSYRGEGALNIVLSYIGTSPQFVGKVLRIQKAGREKQTGESPLTDVERIMWKEESELASCETKEMVDHLYGRLVMSPLLDPSRVDPGVPVTVSKDFLAAVERNTKGVRPTWRVAAAPIDLSRCVAFLMSDHSLFPPGGPCLSVEIKPKCGFLPTSDFIDERFSFKKYISRYRMHQVLKLERNEISEMSEYEPLDLFSGERGRIYKALRDLLKTPQNNLRVFVDGSIIWGGMGMGRGNDDAETFARELETFMCESSETVVEKLIELVGDTMHGCGVLDRLLEVQKLDKLDVEGAIHAYYNATSQPCRVCTEIEDHRKFECLHSMGLDESIKIVKDFLIAATAKDCSIMLTFKPARFHASPHLVTSPHRTVCYKVNYIDLDLKSLRKMEDYYKLDHKILLNYAQTNLRK